MKNIFIVGIESIENTYDELSIYMNSIMNGIHEDVQYYILSKTQKESDKDYIFLYKQHKNDFQVIYNYINEKQLDHCYIYIFKTHSFFQTDKYLQLLKEKNCQIINHVYKEKNKNIIENKINKYSNHTICNNKILYQKIKENYTNMMYLPYGIKEKINKELPDELQIDDYYLVYGNNNIELILKEYLKAQTKRKLLILSNLKDDKRFHILDSKYSIKNNNQIVVYDLKDYTLLPMIASKAFAYISGSENKILCPYLLDILAYCKLNILKNTEYNQKIGEDSCIYFNLENNSLSQIIKHVEGFNQSYIEELGNKINQKIKENYTYQDFIEAYMSL